MNALDLGISQDDLRAEIIDRAAQKLYEHALDHYSGEIQTKFSKAAEQAFDRGLAAYIKRHVEPQIKSILTEMRFQATNGWGEPIKEKPQTLKEYVVAFVEKYLSAPVDYEGRKPEYGRSTQTRISWMISSQLKFEIDTALKAVINDANKLLVGGLEGTVKLCLNEIAQALKIPPLKV